MAIVPYSSRQGASGRTSGKRDKERKAPEAYWEPAPDIFCLGSAS